MMYESCYFSGGPWSGRYHPVDVKASKVNVPEVTESGVVIHQYAREDRFNPEREDQVFRYVGIKE